MKLRILGPLLLLLTLTGCYSAAKIGKLPRIPAAYDRPGEIRCCLIREGDVWVEIDEAAARALYSAARRHYYMDGISYGNLLKNVAERDGIIKQYENYPCVETK